MNIMMNILALVESLDKTMLNIRDKRLKARNAGKGKKNIEKANIGPSSTDEIDKECTSDIEKELAELKKNEPTSDNQFFRMCIASYEFGDLHRSIVYSERFKNDPKIRSAHLANGKLALADLLTQLNLLCITQEWDFEGLRRLGVEHLKERHQDFRRDGWSEMGGKKEDNKDSSNKKEGDKDNDDKKDGNEKGG